MIRHLGFGIALAALAAVGCGEDKGYGDPIVTLTGEQSATLAIDNAALLLDDSSNDAALFALNSLSANINVLVGAKIQAEYMDQGGYDDSGDSYLVGEDCVVVADGSVTYDDCDFQGSTVDGTIEVGVGSIDIDLAMVADFPEEDFRTEINIDASLDVDAASVLGHLDFRTKIRSEDLSATANMFSDFDVILADGCAVGGDLEVHAVAKANGQSEDFWVKAEYGPTCGDIAIY